LHKSLAADACREVNDRSMIRLSDSIDADDNRVGTLPDGGIERSREVFWLPHVEELGLDAKRSGRSFYFLPLRRDTRITHIEQGRDPCGFRNQFPE
jgi:hypothetical protein